MTSVFETQPGDMFVRLFNERLHFAQKNEPTLRDKIALHFLDAAAQREGAGVIDEEYIREAYEKADLVLKVRAELSKKN